MILSRSLERKWICRYKTFFVIGLLILLFQVYLAFRFFSLNGEESDESSLLFAHKTNNIEIVDEENSVNKIKDGTSIDDEDILSKTFEKKATNSLKTNKSNLVLRLEELEFTPPCKITTREAISAIHRSKTQKCKSLIANITCLINQHVFYPQKLPNYCPNDGYTYAKPLGCFKDEKSFRLLNGYYGNYKQENSPEFCIQLCLQSGFVYAGVQYGTECFCGNDEPASKLKLPDSSCNKKCPNDSHSVCGGYYTVNVYETGISKFKAQIAEIGTDLKPARIVFLLTLNGRALRQVKRLIKILYHRDHYFYIHVDVRQDYLFRELLRLETFPNIRLTRTRFSTIWGGASLLQMLLSSMRELLTLPWTWDFVINLSESDYPVKPIQNVELFLSANLNRNFVKSHGRDTQRFIQKQGLDKTFIECEHRMWRIGDRKLPKGIQIDGGSDWIALSRNFISYATNQSDQLVNGLIKLFTYTLLPAESFFHTLLRNSHFCHTYIDNNLHVTNWKRKLGCKCQYKHIVDWCGCSPNDFRPDDWLRIQNTESKQIFFARKFEPIVNQMIIFQLEQWLMKDKKIVVNQHAYWQSIYHHLDLTSSDDSLLTVAHSVMRAHSQCLPNGYEIREITSFHYNDQYQATLIRFHIGGDEYEVQFKPKDKFKIIKSTGMSRRFRSLIISTDYDQKEQIFRNFNRIIGPYSEPVLVYEVEANPELNSNINNLTFLWIDPNGQLVDVQNGTVDDLFVIGYVKPLLKQPILPGEWTLRVIYKSNLIVETTFLITPIEFYLGLELTQGQFNFLYAQTSLQNLREKEFSKFRKFLHKINSNQAIPLNFTSNSLQQWIDDFVRKFYEIGDVCGMSEKNHKFCKKTIEHCSETNWSTHAPDPKSFIGQLNESSGRFDLW